MKLGCSTILYGGHDLAEALAGIRKAGYAAIELCAIPGMAPHISAQLSAAQAQDVKTQVADSGLTIESVGGSGNPLSAAPDSDFVRLLRVASQLGAPAVTTGSGYESDDAGLAQAIETIHQVTPIARDLGVRISLKPHVRQAVYSTPSALRFMQEVDAEWIGINFDASHLWRTDPPEVPEDSISQLGSHMITARIRDTLSHDTPIGSVETQIPGGGAMNLSAIATALGQLQHVPYSVLEIVGTKEFPLEKVQGVVQTCYDRLAPLFA